MDNISQYSCNNFLLYIKSLKMKFKFLVVLLAVQIPGNIARLVFVTFYMKYNVAIQERLNIAF